jgi:hypothetical protein
MNEIGTLHQQSEVYNLSNVYSRLSCTIGSVWAASYLSGVFFLDFIISSLSVAQEYDPKTVSLAWHILLVGIFGSKVDRLRFPAKLSL